MKGIFLSTILFCFLFATAAQSQVLFTGVKNGPGEFSGMIGSFYADDAFSGIGILDYGGNFPTNIWGYATFDFDESEFSGFGLGTSLALPVKSCDITLYPSVWTPATEFNLSFFPFIIASKKMADITPYLAYSPEIYSEDGIQFGSGVAAFGIDLPALGGSFRPEVFHFFQYESTGFALAYNYYFKK